MTALAVLYIVVRFTLLKYLLEHKVYPTTVLDRFPGFLAAVLLYIKVLVLPFHLHMEYGGWAGTLGHPLALLGLVVFGGLLFVIYKERQRRGLVFFAVAWFLVALLPVSNLYPINAFMAEHWLYLPSIGFFLIVAGYFSTWLRRDRTRFSAWAGLILLAGFWGVLTVRQNVTWLEPIPFFHRLLRYAPFSSRVYNSLGMAYNNIGEYETGVGYLEKAVELSANAAQSDAVKAYNNLALVYNTLGKNEEAARIAQGALVMDATHSKAYNNLAISLVRLGKYEEAVEACEKALAQKPGYAKAYNTMAAAYMNMERYEESLKSYQKAIEFAPDYPEAHNNLGLLLQKMGRAQEAVPWHEKAIALRPDYDNAYNNLGRACATLGRLEEAVAAFKKVIDLEPRRADAYLNLAGAYLKSGQYRQAVSCRDKAREMGMVSPELDEALASSGGSGG